MTSPALIECRAQYGVGVSLLALRWFTRWKTVGSVRHWQLDDFFSVMAFVFYTILYSLQEFMAFAGSTAGLSPAQRQALDPQAIKLLTGGTQAMFASYYILIFLAWSLKGCIIVLFLRLTDSLSLYRYVTVVAWVSVVFCVAAVFTQTIHCLPLEKNWQIVPDPGSECSKGTVVNIMIALSTVLVDALLLLVPVLLLRKTLLNIWRKAFIGALLSLGVFVMGMAIARCVTSIDQTEEMLEGSVWADREATVSIFAVNAPIFINLFRTATWRPQKTSSYPQENGSHFQSDGTTRNSLRVKIPAGAIRMESYIKNGTDGPRAASTSNLIVGGSVARA